MGKDGKFQHNSCLLDDSMICVGMQPCNFNALVVGEAEWMLALIVTVGNTSFHRKFPNLNNM